MNHVIWFTLLQNAFLQLILNSIYRIGLLAKDNVHASCPPPARSFCSSRWTSPMAGCCRFRAPLEALVEQLGQP